MYDWYVSDPGTRMWLLLLRAQQAACKVAEIEARRFGITLGQLNVLMLVASSKTALTPSQIASYLFREKHTISERITCMEKAGYLRKMKSPDDDRLVRVSLAPKGKEALRVVLAGLPNSRAMRKYLAGFEFKAEVRAFLEGVRDVALGMLEEDLVPLPLSFDPTKLGAYIDSFSGEPEEFRLDQIELSTQAGSRKNGS